MAPIAAPDCRARARVCVGDAAATSARACITPRLVRLGQARLGERAAALEQSMAALGYRDSTPADIQAKNDETLARTRAEAATVGAHLRDMRDMAQAA